MSKGYGFYGRYMKGSHFVKYSIKLMVRFGPQLRIIQPPTVENFAGQPLPALFITG